MCGKPGFAKARTYIEGGNVIFESELKEDAVRHELEKALYALREDGEEDSRDGPDAVGDAGNAGGEPLSRQGAE